MDLVVSDVVPLACAAADLAGVPSVCVSNFSWGMLSPEISDMLHVRLLHLDTRLSSLERVCQRNAHGSSDSDIGLTSMFKTLGTP